MRFSAVFLILLSVSAFGKPLIIKPPYGEDWHLSLKSHQLMADKAIVFIKKFMNW